MSEPQFNNILGDDMQSNKEALKSLETVRSVGSLQNFSTPDVSNMMKKGKMMNKNSTEFNLGESKSVDVKKFKAKQRPSALNQHFGNKFAENTLSK